MITLQPDLFDLGERLKEPKPVGTRCTAAPSGSGPDGETCRTCRHKTPTFSGSGKRFLKCGLMQRSWTHGGGTDIKARWPACHYWEPIPPS